MSSNLFEKVSPKKFTPRSDHIINGKACVANVLGERPFLKRIVWEGCRESRRYSRDTYPESYITKYTSIRI